MKKLMTILAVSCALSAAAADAWAGKMPDWHDPQVVEENREPMTATFSTGGLKLSLSGMWKFCWYETIPMSALEDCMQQAIDLRPYGKDTLRTTLLNGLHKGHM